MEYYGHSVFVMTVFLFLPKLPAEELFSSMEAMERLIETERDTLLLLQDFRDREFEKLEVVKQHVKLLRRNLYEKQVQPPVESQQLVEAFRDYRSIKLHGMDWANVEAVYEEPSTVTEIDATVKALREGEKLPTDKDIQGAAEALQRIQTTYRVRAKDIANGQILATRATPRFTARECYLVGNKLATVEAWGSAVKWLEIAAEISDQEMKKTTDPVGILDWLQFAGWFHNQNASRALEITLKINELNPTFGNLEANLRHYRDKIANSTPEEREKMESPTAPFQEPSENSALQQLCRGELKPLGRNPKDELCYYETYNHPFLLLQPIKKERVYADPEVFILHDVLLKSQLERLPQISFDYLKKAGQYHDPEKAGAKSNDTGRVSRLAIFNGSFSSVIEEVNQRAAMITNLNVSTAEDLQINNYGLGGRFVPHIDQFLSSTHHVGWRPDYGNRIASLMFWLTDVEIGGATVFPHLNLTLIPEKGSAAFWYNLYQDGTSDTRLQHSGCTIMLGSKWIANKWFRERGQETARPCGLMKDIPVLPVPLSMMPARGAANGNNSCGANNLPRSGQQRNQIGGQKRKAADMFIRSVSSL